MVSENQRTFLEPRSFALIALLCFILSPLPNSAAPPERPDTWVDRDYFPEAYGILSSDRIMFPDNVSDRPLKIGAQRQLFVDDRMVGSIDNLARQFHQPTKHTGNPLVPGGSFAVLRDDTTGKFRMWNNLSFLESDDGIRWTEPRLGPEGNRLFDAPAELRGLIYNPDLPKDQNRYKAVIERRVNEETKEPGGFYLYDSTDGLHWQQARKRPILQRTINSMNPGPYWAKGTGDTSTFRYDTVLKQYIWDGKFNLYHPQDKIEQLGIVPDHKPRLRLRTFSLSDDLVHWTSPRFLFYPDRYDQPDCQLYGHVGFVYESMWIGLIRVLHVIPTGWKQVDIQLSYSRDGRHWSRSRQRQPFIPLGDADSWDADYSGAAFTAPVLVGDELWFYYFGSRHPDRDKRPDNTWSRNIGLAKLRRDGFASLNAGQEPGHVTTRPLSFQGRTLYVNADVAEGGWVKAAVLSRDAQPVDGYLLGDSIPMTNDTTQEKMSWRSQDKLVEPGDGHVRILFELKQARLYSFWIE